MIQFNIDKDDTGIETVVNSFPKPSWNSKNTPNEKPSFDSEDQTEDQSFDEPQEPPEHLDREALITQYKHLQDQKRTSKRRNTFLHSSMIKFVRENLLDITLDTLSMTERDGDVENLYEKRLIMYGDMVEKDKKERHKIEDVVKGMKEKSEILKFKLENDFQTLIKKQLEISKTFIDPSTGETVYKKLIGRFFKQQYDILQKLAEVRLKNIKAREKTRQKLEILKAVETLDENVNLSGFEQLTYENEIFKTKTDEREEGLNKLRVKITGSIQRLADLRQMSHCLAFDLSEKTEELQGLEREVNFKREELDHLNFKYSELNKIQAAMCKVTGLQTQPILLKDFQETVNEIDDLEARLEELKLNVTEQSKQKHFDKKKKIKKMNDRSFKN